MSAAAPNATAEIRSRVVTTRLLICFEQKGQRAPEFSGARCVKRRMQLRDGRGTRGQIVAHHSHRLQRKVANKPPKAIATLEMDRVLRPVFMSKPMQLVYTQ